MKGFKMFDEDWKCQGFQFEVGKSYEMNDKPILCKKGFHFCEKLEDCFNYYDAVTWNHIAEIEVYGDVVGGGNDSKKATNKIKIIREVLTSELKNWSDGINGSYGINWSNGINRSNGINGSDGINWSNGINRSDGINGSNGINLSNGINRSDGINLSSGINGSSGINRSIGINWSNGINGSSGINGSNGINWSYGVINSFGVDRAIFLADKPRKYTVFGKKVTKKHFDEVYQTLFSKLNGWKPTFNNLHSLYLKYGSNWKLTPIPKAKEISKEEAWASMPKEAIEYVKSLPEFNAKIFEKVTGIKL